MPVGTLILVLASTGTPWVLAVGSAGGLLSASLLPVILEFAIVAGAMSEELVVPVPIIVPTLA